MNKQNLLLKLIGMLLDDSFESPINHDDAEKSLIDAEVYNEQ